MSLDFYWRLSLRITAGGTRGRTLGAGAMAAGPPSAEAVAAAVAQRGKDATVGPRMLKELALELYDAEAAKIVAYRVAAAYQRGASPCQVPVALETSVRAVCRALQQVPLASACP